MTSDGKSVDPKTTMASTPAPRFVPGAPSPAPLTKSQKKKLLAKRKPAHLSPDHHESQGLAEHSPVDSIAPETSNQFEQKVLPEEEIAYKPSAMAEFIGKRLKATTKKIARISTYTTMDIEKLDDGQRQSLKTLPGLEAIQKELGEVKKAIDVYDLEFAHEQTSKRIEAEQAEKQKISDVIAAAEATYTAKVSDLLSFLRLHADLSAGRFESPDESTIAAVTGLGEALLGSEGESKEVCIRGFLSGDGSFQDVTYARILEIVQLYVNPPREPTPIPDEPESDIPLSMESTIVSEVDAAAVESEIPPKPSTGSFHFMQASELEPSFEEGAEWVERTDGVQSTEEPQIANDTVEARTEVDTNGQDLIEAQAALKEAPAASGTGPIDWADEEGGLPSIDVLQAKFGTSGTATPVTPGAESGVEYQNASDVNGVHMNDATASQEGEEGFTQARGGRGRGRSYRGDRGSMRGGYRGAGRGGDRGYRGYHRGGDRGAFRGRSASSGEWRGDGESRGRGARGRGRGGDRRGRGEVAPPPS